MTPFKNTQISTDNIINNLLVEKALRKEDNKYQAFLDKAKAVHGNKYDYSLVEYKNYRTKINIVCRKHGVFAQSPAKHLLGQNCPCCAGNKKLSVDEFVNRAHAVHGSYYDYSQVDYRGIDTKVIIVCPKHGAFKQTPYEHLRRHGCGDCGNNSLTKEEFISKAVEKYGDSYGYDLVKYVNQKTKVDIICKLHGVFQQTPQKHLALNSIGCQSCAVESKKKTTQEYIADARAIHGDRYDYSKAEYGGVFDHVVITCPRHGDFSQLANTHLSNHGCPKCGTMISSGQHELTTLLPDGVEYVMNDRSVLDPLELDIWIPAHKFAIEFHGHYWHGVNRTTMQHRSRLRTQHYQKSVLAEQAGIDLMQIYDIEYATKRNILSSMIAHRLGFTAQKVFARECSVVDECDASFYTDNHMQGYRPASTHVALVHKGLVVAAMSFAAHQKYDAEIIRYCCRLDTSVVGGFSKCLKHYCSKYRPMTVVSFSDRRFGFGNVYRQNGFVYVGTSNPNYKYCKHNKIYSRNKCQKHKLEKLLGKNFNSELSESMNMINNGFTQLFDAGNDKWVWKSNAN